MMALSTEDLYDKAKALSGDVEDNFLELGRSLRQLLDRDPELFKKIVAKTNLGRREGVLPGRGEQDIRPAPHSTITPAQDRLDQTPTDRQAHRA
jgi:hypothetical protein